MDEISFCRMGLVMVSLARSRPPSTPTTFPSTPRFIHRTPEPGLLTRRIRYVDFTAKAVSSDTSGPSETAAPTLPSFKSKELVQKERLNSTLERFVIPLAFFDSQIPNFPCIISV